MTTSSPPPHNVIHAPLSWSQQGLWVLEQLETGQCTYNLCWALRIVGRVDIDYFNQAINSLVQRHAILRTVFQYGPQGPEQIVLPELVINIPLRSIEEMTSEKKIEEIRYRFSKEVNTPFDLETGPLLRGSLYSTGKNEYLFIMTMHHIIIDGWSMPILFKEFVDSYAAINKGETLPQNDPSLQYYQFATNQINNGSDKSLVEGFAYWQKQLSGLLPRLDLPTDFPRTGHHSLKGARFFFKFPATTCEQIHIACKKERVTMYMYLLTVFKILLYRYTGQDDLLVGSPTANRTRDTFTLLGFFVNTIVLRTDYGGNPSFRDVLAKEKQAVIDGMRHMAVPLGKIVEKLSLKYSRDGSQLLQTMFTLQNIPLPQLGDENMQITPVNIDFPDDPEFNWIQNDTGWSEFDLILELTNQQGGLVGAFEYNSSLFTKETIARMQEHFLLLLDAVLSDPKQHIGNLNMLSAKEYALLHQWNETDVAFIGHTKTLVELFAEQVVRSPDATAVVFHNDSLSYRELDQRANQLAHYLCDNGVVAESLVAVCLDRSIEMVVALLGILKSGGAYVPIDPSYPEDRISYMISDSKASMIITCEQFLSHISEHGARVICLGTDNALSAYPVESPQVHVSPEHLAYVIYTSGSTGKPKGVMIPNSAITNHMLWMQSVCPVGVEDAVLQKTSFSFDASVWEFYAPLLTGGRLVMARQGGHLDPDYLIQTIQKYAITTLQLVPSMLGVLLEQKSFAKCLSLNQVYCGGEALSLALVTQFHDTFTSVDLYNLYGPSEATIDATFSLCRRGGTTVSIGRPVANCKAFILDRNLTPVPVGVIGELYLSGAGLARGYLNQPKLTAQKFIDVTDRQLWETDIRLYKTGDLARFISGGDIQYMGRTDHQIKLRGFRVELGEIESVINKSDLVYDNAVLAHGEGGRMQYLQAYVVPADMSLSFKALKEQLLEDISEKLPEYMVPSIFIEMDRLPHTPNGKIDRKALPEPELNSDIIHTAPETPLEHELVAVWQDLLGSNDIGLHDNFFDLGGHSLLTVRLLARINEKYGQKVALSHFFKNPTIQWLALRIEGGEDFVPDDSKINLDQEAVLEPEILVENRAVVSLKRAENIFITGVTGFVGAFLLKELLHKTSARIHCLVRAKNAEEGEERIRKGLEFYKIWDPQLASRIVPVPGDLAVKNLGIDAAKHLQLQKEIDIIYHNGALVHHILPFSTLKAANVNGTMEVLKLACTKKCKPVHFISTLDVFSSSVGKQLCTESTPIDQEEHLESKGYSSSKWVAEKLVQIARKRGIPTSIYRLGLVAADSRSGACNTSDHMGLFIRSCITMDCFPETMPSVQLGPVDTLTEAIVYLSGREDLQDKDFHLFNPEAIPAETILSECRNQNGTKLKPITNDKWFDMVEAGKNSEQALPITPYLSMYRKALDEYVQSEGKQKELYGCRTTLAYLEQGKIRYPELTSTALNAYFAFLTDIED